LSKHATHTSNQINIQGKVYVRLFVGRLKLKLPFLSQNTVSSIPMSVLRNWRSALFSSSPPIAVKWGVLQRFSSGNTWIETGTLRGDTTQHLNQLGNNVVTIEASKFWFEKAAERFLKNPQITPVYGESTDVLAKEVMMLLESGVREISFFLDGHYSGGNTFQGTKDTPIVKELEIIESFLNRIETISVFVDDIRLFSKFNTTHGDYPELSYLTQWAQRNNLEWTIELDVFVATNNLSRINTYVNGG
jgi:hypothetical protein